MGQVIHMAKAAVKKPAKKAPAKAPGPKQAQATLIKYALSFPETTLEYPWGDEVVKVKGKMFAAFGGDPAGAKEMSMSVKLPVSSEMALTLPWVQPTGYGLGKSGWVTARIEAGHPVDFDTLKGWIAQSYRAVAPKAVLKKLES
jgi:predicted DNA-binding protein (MmcQ/YjbR family)